MQETRFFQKTRFEICQKLDFARNFVKFGGHFGTKHQYFHLKLTNFGCKSGKLDFKRQKLDFKAKKLSKNQKTRSENQKTRFQKPKNSIYRHFERVQKGEIVLKKTLGGIQLSPLHLR